MLKKLFILNIAIVLLLSTTVFAAPVIDSNDKAFFMMNEPFLKPEVINEEAPIYLQKETESDIATNDLKFVTFLKPDDFTIPFETRRDSFNFSVKAISDDLVMKLYVFDETQGIFVPVKKEITVFETGEKVSVDTSWKFGLSGYLLCSFKLPGEGSFEYRIYIYKAQTAEEQFVIDENLQIHDFTVNYKKAVSFENVLTNSFWNIFFDPSKYSFPQLP